jgi:hypothetical protein
MWHRLSKAPILSEPAQIKRHITFLSLDSCLYTCRPSRIRMLTEQSHLTLNSIALSAASLPAWSR